MQCVRVHLCTLRIVSVTGVPVTRAKHALRTQDPDSAERRQIRRREPAHSMLGAAFGAGRSSDEPSSRSHKSYDTYGHSTSHPLRYSRPFGWVAHKPHIERAAGAFAAGFMSASGAHYAGYPRQQAGPAFEQADMIMARAAVLKRSNGQLWRPARTTHMQSSTDSNEFLGFT